MPLAAIDPPELLFSCPSLGLFLALAAAAAVPAAAEMGLHNRDTVYTLQQAAAL